MGAPPGAAVPPRTGAATSAQPAGRADAPFTRRRGLMALGAGGLVALLGLCVLLGLGALALRAIANSRRLALSSTPTTLAAVITDTVTTGTVLTDTLQAATDTAPAPTDTETPVPATATEPPPTDTVQPYSPTDTAAPPAPTQNQGDVLFSDNFSSSKNGWPVGTRSYGEYQITNGKYDIKVSETDTLAWAAPDQTFADASITADAAFVSGATETYFGLICRFNDPDKFYYFVIRPDGKYMIGIHQNKEFNALIAGGWQSSNAIVQGVQINHLRADCVGNTLTMYANGVQLAQVQDSTLKSGNPGVASAALDANGSEVTFDLFVVRNPAP